MPTALLLEGESGSLTVPVPAYLIAHPKGYALFDSGLHVDTQVDADRRLGRLAPFHTVHFAPGEAIAARLGGLGVAPERVDHVINSHLHFDHCGGNAQLPNATLIVRRPAGSDLLGRSRPVPARRGRGAWKRPTARRRPSGASAILAAGM